MTKNRRQTGSSQNLPAPAGPYSPAVRIEATVACAGQAGFAADGTLASGIADQTRQALRNVDAALRSVGSSLDEVLHVRVYLTEIVDFEPMNRVYAEFFSHPYPARTTVYVGLPPGLLVEIDAIAVSPNHA